MWKVIPTNNKRKVVISEADAGIMVQHINENGDINRKYIIPDHEIVMLINYYNNCKSGIEKSNYILEK